MMSRLRRSMAGRDQGFTLVELLVVIIIIGILAAIAIPVFLNQRKKAIDASLKADLESAAVIMETWAVENPATRPAYQDVHAPGAISGVMDGLKVSPGNRVEVLATSAVGGWCLYATNPKASEATGTGGYMVWRSLRGGLDPDISGGGADCG